MGFSDMFAPWSEKNAVKKIGQAIENQDAKTALAYLTKRKPQNFNYTMYGHHPDSPYKDKTPIRVFGNPIDLAVFVGFDSIVPALRQAGYTVSDEAQYKMDQRAKMKR